jgi:multiple sugar transport system substrate-binding protein
MFMSWWWLLPSFDDPEQSVEEVVGNVTFAPPPGWEDKETVPYALSLPIGINKFSKYPEAAWEYIKMMTDPGVDKDRVIDKSDPETSTVVAVHLSVLRDPEVNAISGGMHEAGAESLSRAKIMPMIPEWPEVSSVLESAIQEMATGAPVKETLDRAAEEVRDIMDRAGYYD